MSESEVDPLSFEKAFSSVSDSDSGDDNDLPLTELKKKTKSAKKSAQVILKCIESFSCYCFLRIASALSKLN